MGNYGKTTYTRRQSADYRKTMDDYEKRLQDYMTQSLNKPRGVFKRRESLAHKGFGSGSCHF